MSEPSNGSPNAASHRREAADAWAYEEPPARRSRARLPPLVVGAALLAGALVVGWLWTGGRLGGDGMTGMDGMGDPTAGGQLPAVAGFAHGQAVDFVHTEASDPDVASMLTAMMGSPVLVVPLLADVPDGALAAVFVFRNGVQPDGPLGPFGFQPDVFDSVPGDASYSPLRRVMLVTWHGGAAARVLRSAEEVREAEAAGEVSIEQTATVVNMPMIRWPGGSR